MTKSRRIVRPPSVGSAALVALLAVLAAGGGAGGQRPAPARTVLAGPRPLAAGGELSIGVWLQAPANARAYRDIGVNHYIGLWEGPTEAQLAALASAGMPVYADQNAVGLAHREDPTIAGWLQQDEPDNAQPDGAGGYGPCVEPAVMIARYEAMRAADPGRPVLLNLGQNVAWDEDRPYIGRGSACSRRWDQYPEYVKAADIVSFDIYPVTSPYENIRGQLWRVALGIDRLRAWTGGGKPVWAVLETTHIDSETMPTPRDLRAETWMALVHGASGLFYFAHEWRPAFREAGLLHYPEMRAAVTAQNRELQALAPVLAEPGPGVAVGVASTNPAVPVDILAKRHGGWLYVFAVAMRGAPTRATFSIAGARPGAAVEVLGEGRRLPFDGRAFSDDFEGYGVHLYRLPAGGWLGLPWLWR